MPIRTLVSLAALALLAPAASAHGDHSAIPEGEVISVDPIDSILWTHIILMAASFGVLYPLGMVLGLVKSRFHVPVQILASAVATTGYFLGHMHKGRQFSHNVHAKFATPLMLGVAAQGVLGVLLKMHIERGFLGKMRRFGVLLHGVLGKAMPIAAWVQMLFGGIVLEGFCTGDHLGQCLAHFIMGSAFIGYGMVLTILLLVGQEWLKRRGKSQEFFDSALIAAWGCVNTFTEHRWGGPWVRNDLQHTTMGIIWWAAGLVGMWLSYDSAGRPKRNLIPGIVIGLTGWAMSAHPQELMLSTMVHSVFGYTLMAAGLTRIIEIAFVVKDKNSYGDLLEEQNPGRVKPAGEEETHSFQYLPPFLLYASGFLFMGATEEQMAMLASHEVTHVSYILILYSVAFVLFLFVNMLLRVYSSHTAQKQVRLGPVGDFEPVGHANVGMSERQPLHPGEDYELEGLISDDEEATLEGSHGSRDSAKDHHSD